MKRTLFIWGIYFLSLASSTYAASIVIQSVFPNTSNDAALEYIEVQNTSCDPVEIGGYTLKDASGKVFIFPSSILEPRQSLRFGRQTTGIALNNSDESVELYDSSGIRIDSKSYSTSTKDQVIAFQIQPETCLIPAGNQESGISSNMSYPEMSADMSNTGILDSKVLDSKVLESSDTKSDWVFVDAISDEKFDPKTFYDLVFTGSIYSGALLSDFILDGYAIKPQSQNNQSLSQQNQTSREIPLAIQCKVLPDYKANLEELGDEGQYVSGSAVPIVSGGTNGSNSSSQANAGDGVFVQDEQEGHQDLSDAFQNDTTALQEVTDVLQSDAVVVQNTQDIQEGQSSSHQGAPNIESPTTSVSPTSTGTTMTMSGTGIITPEKLYLWDMNSNGKLDTVEIEYSGFLSGSIDINKLTIYSAAGALSELKIEGSSLIQSAKIEENRLIIYLHETSRNVGHWKISSSTSSFFRIKNYSGIGLIGSNGNQVQALTYTQSFDEYSPERIWNYVEYPDSGKPPVIMNQITGSSSSFIPVSILSSVVHPTSTTQLPELSIGINGASGTTQVAVGGSNSILSQTGGLQVEAKTPKISLVNTIQSISLSQIAQSGVNPSGGCIYDNCRVNFVFSESAIGLKKADGSSVSLDYQSKSDSVVLCEWVFDMPEKSSKSYTTCNPPLISLGEKGGEVTLVLKEKNGIEVSSRKFSIIGPVSSFTQSIASKIEEQKTGNLTESIVRAGKKSTQSTLGNLNVNSKTIAQAKLQTKEQSKSPSSKTAVNKSTTNKSTSKSASTQTSSQKKSSTKTADSKKVTMSSAEKKKSESKSTKGNSSTSSSGSVKSVDKKTAVNSQQDNNTTQTITGVLGVACTVLGFVFAAYKKKVAAE